MKWWILILVVVFVKSPLVSQDTDAFKEHVLRKEKEAQERLEQEKNLNQNLYDSLRKGLRNDDPQIRLQSLKAIMRMEEVEGKELLIKEYLDDRVPEIRMTILDYYGQQLRPQDLETVLWVIEDENLKVRLKLVEILLNFQNSGIQVYDLMSLLFEDRQIVIRKALLEGLSAIPQHLLDPQRTFNIISNIIYNDALDLRLLALDIIKSFPLYITHDTLEATLRDAQLPVRQMSIEIVGQKPEEKSTKLLADRLNDPNPKVRERAIYFLGQRLDEDIIRVFENHLLHEPNTLLRKQIMTEVSRHRSPLAVSILSGYLDDAVLEIRQHAAQLLSDMQETVNLDLYGFR